MAGRSEVLLEMWKDHRQQARQHETQRSVMTNVIMLLSAAVVAVIAQLGLHRASVPLTIALAILGVYGFVAAAKYHERFRASSAECHDFLALLDVSDPGLRLVQTRAEATRRQRQQFPLTARLNLSYIWLVLFVILFASGVILTIVCW